MIDKDPPIWKEVQLSEHNIRKDNDMDPELKAYLDTMQKTLAQEIAMSRHHAEELSRATRNDAVLK